MKIATLFFLLIYVLMQFARAPFSWATQHTTVCLDIRKTAKLMYCNCELIQILCHSLSYFVLFGINFPSLALPEEKLYS